MKPSHPILWALLAAALFGASAPLVKPLLGSVNPFSLAGLLYLGAAAGVAPFARRGGRSRGPRLRTNRRRLAGVVLFGGVLAPVLLLAGLSLAPAGSVALWLTLEAPATAVVGRLLFREHLGPPAVGAVALLVAASVILAAPNGFGTAPAAALIALACLCWGLDNNLTALIDGFTPVQTTLVKGAVAGSINLALGIWFGASLPAAVVAGAALLVGAASYGLSLVLYINAAHHLGATRSQTVFATAPFWGAALAWTLLAEPVAPVQVVAAGLMAIAVWLMHVERHGHKHTHTEVTHTHRHRHDDGFHHDHPHGNVSARAWHSHEHDHQPVTHGHEHRPDLHHRHEH